jgi:peptidoglycan/xylan/chitin deacetylase (PgdA/CDA1 family)
MGRVRAGLGPAWARTRVGLQCCHITKLGSYWALVQVGGLRWTHSRGLRATSSDLGGLCPPSSSYSLAQWTECSQRSHPLPNSPTRPLPTAALRHAGGSGGHQTRKPLSSPKPNSQTRWVITELIGPPLSRGAPRMADTAAPRWRHGHGHSGEVR